MAETKLTNGIDFQIDAAGGLTLTVPFWANTLEAALVAAPLFYEGMKREGVSGKERPSSCGFDLTARYVGLAPEDPSGSGPEDREDGEWEVDPSFSEEPIESHHQLAAIMEKWGGYEDEDGKVKFPRTLPRNWSKTGGGRGLRESFEQTRARMKNKNPAFGLESYFVTGAIVRRTRIRSSVPGDFMRNANKIIARPPIQALANVDWGDRNFLTLTPRPRSKGNAVELVEEWMLSAPGGWNEVAHDLIDAR